MGWPWRNSCRSPVLSENRRRTSDWYFGLRVPRIQESGSLCHHALNIPFLNNLCFLQLTTAHCGCSCIMPDGGISRLLKPKVLTIQDIDLVNKVRAGSCMELSI